MAQRSDAKAKMVTAARQLIRERGYHATVMSDVLELSEAPRGSVYFHFPKGKTQLAVAAVEAHARDQAELIERAGEGSNSISALVDAYIGRARENLVKSNYTQGCTVAPLVLEGAREPDELAEAARAAFSVMIESLAFQFAVFGMARTRALELAEVVVSGVEGALLMARAFRSAAPFDSMLVALQNHVSAAEPTSASASSRARKNTKPKARNA
jgi:TetR/AcrR family transcriptional repressor of lmrAB and yxaGH operons